MKRKFNPDNPVSVQTFVYKKNRFARKGTPLKLQQGLDTLMESQLNFPKGVSTKNTQFWLEPLDNGDRVLVGTVENKSKVYGSLYRTFHYQSSTPGDTDSYFTIDKSKGTVSFSDESNTDVTAILPSLVERLIEDLPSGKKKSAKFYASFAKDHDVLAKVLEGVDKLELNPDKIRNKSMIAAIGRLITALASTEADLSDRLRPLTLKVNPFNPKEVGVVFTFRRRTHLFTFKPVKGTTSPAYIGYITSNGKFVPGSNNIDLPLFLLN